MPENAGDPIAQRSFRAELDRLHASASRRGPAALKAPLKSKLRSLLSAYRPKLTPVTYQAALLEAGDLLLELQEFAAARKECYEPISGLAASDGLAASGEQALTQRARAEYGAIECSFLVLMARDPALLKATSAAALSALLRRARAAMALCVPHEPLYWVVFNGSVLCYRLCRPALTLERASVTIETLAYCALALEGMLPLLQSRFLGWRVRVYIALCHAYEASGSVSGAKRAADHALQKLEQVHALTRHDPVPPTARATERVGAARRTFRALGLKYSGAATLGGPLVELFGEGAASQLAALMELVADYGRFAKRILAQAPAPEQRDEAGKARVALAQDALSAALAIAEPMVASIAAPEKLAAERAAAEEAAAEAAAEEKAVAEGEAPDEAAAAEAAEVRAAAAAAREDAAAAAEVAAEAAAAAAAEFPLSLQVKRSTGHTHTPTENTTHDNDTHTHTHTTRTTPQTNNSHTHLTTLEGAATTVRATSLIAGGVGARTLPRRQLLGGRRPPPPALARARGRRARRRLRACRRHVASRPGDAARGNFRVW